MNEGSDLPTPTYWPFFFALGMTTMAWGFLTSGIVAAIGGAVLLVSTLGWMKEVSK